MPWKTCHWKRETCKKKPPLVASSFMGILSYYLLCKLIYDHSSCGVSICQIGLVLVFQMRPISCPSDKMSIEVGSSARCGKNWQSRQPRGCRELLLSRPTPKLTQHAPRPSAYQDLYLQHNTHTHTSAWFQKVESHFGVSVQYKRFHYACPAPPSTTM